MCNLCTTTINGVWANINIGATYATPDNIKSAEFRISDINQHKIEISPQNINIRKDSFVKALEYLIHNNHNLNNPINIESNNDGRKSGPLCATTRAENNNVRCINYILPILKEFNLVDTDGSRPNRAWYL